MAPSPLILGIETSCDDTAAAVISNGKLLSNIVSSQSEHEAFGGVVPELASRAHQRLIVPVVETALEQARVTRDDLNAVAVTYGPGLAGSLLVGLSFAKALAIGLDIPLIGVNHLEGHIYSLFIAETHPEFPFLCLIVSGGHTQLMRVDKGLRYTVLGRTRDDAAGEAFDKVAKLMGLAYPGGPAIEHLAEKGDPEFHRFPRNRLPGFDYSFSGIKTSVLYYLNAFSEAERKALYAEHLSDLCASFQEAVIDMLVQPLQRAVHETGISEIALVGGVSANVTLRARLEALAKQSGGHLFVPDQAYCMDNAAMIAVAGNHKYIAGQHSALTLTVEPSLSLA